MGWGGGDARASISQPEKLTEMMGCLSHNTLAPGLRKTLITIHEHSYTRRLEFPEKGGLGNVLGEQRGQVDTYIFYVFPYVLKMWGRCLGLQFEIRSYIFIYTLNSRLI